MRSRDRIFQCFTVSLDGCQTMEFAFGDKISFNISKKKMFSLSSVRAEEVRAEEKKSSSKTANICLEEITLVVEYVLKKRRFHLVCTTALIGITCCSIEIFEVHMFSGMLVLRQLL